MTAAGGRAHPGGEFRRGWPTLLGAMLGIATGTTGLPFYTFGLFVLPLSTAFGWTRTEIAAATLAKTIGIVATTGPIGALADRIGIRRVAIASMALTGLSYAAFVLLTPSIWSFYILWTAMSAVGGGTSPAIWTRGVAGWFDRHRGIAIGLVLLGTGVSSMVAPPLVQAAIAAAGWRAGYLALAGAALLVGLPGVVLLFRDAPRPPAAAGQPARAPAGLSMRRALRTATFWKLALGISLAGGVITAFIINLVPMASDRGAGAADGAALATLLGGSVIAGRLLVGLLLDRLPAPAVSTGVFLAAALAFAAIAAAPDGTPAVLPAAAVVIGLAAGAEVDLLTFLVARQFGLRAFGAICSWLIVIFTVAAGITPPLASLIRDRSGGYAAALWGGAALLVAATLCFGSIRNTRENDAP